MKIKEFLKYLILITLSSLATLGLLFFMLYLSLAALAAGIQKAEGDGASKKIRKNTVLELRLDYPVKEYNSSPFENFDPVTFKFKPTLTLHQIAEALRWAADDPNIEALLIHPGILRAGLASAGEIRQAIDTFRLSGKKILAYSEFYSQRGYYLASGADDIRLHETGVMEWKGLGSQIFFYKDLLDKLGVKVQVFKKGEFKGAVEPFTRDRLSPENRFQLKVLLQDLWDVMASDVASVRPVDTAALNRMAANLEYATADEWVQSGLIDGTIDNTELRTYLKDQTGVGEDEEIHFIDETDYYYKKKLTKLFDKSFTLPRIAVLTAEGEIVDGEGEPDQIGSDRMVKLIRKLAADEQVKAVVLRINSPGGSGLASDIIWHELQALKKKKPLVVSMGDVAASGGYYIATPADYIFAHPSTITGSIGVFAVIPEVSGLMENKLHIRIDTVKTHPHADMGIFRPLDEKEKAYIGRMIDRMYETFVQRVAEGRNMPPERVDSLGRGRVWSGKRAVLLGLADETGITGDAVAKAAALAGLDDYEVKFYPKNENPLAGLFLMGGTEARQEIIKFLKRRTGISLPSPEALWNPRNRIQARLPYEIRINGAP
ncbi:MAG: signal peptide peptidase SppA [Chlorobi bacterium]|nr:signal peptide peptidase SppA [Chlorobiota bacterium]